MATRNKETAQIKERTLSSSKSMEVPRARRTPKSSIAGSPEKDASILSEKPTPHYLKHTVSSGIESSKNGKKPATEATTTKRLIRKPSMDRQAPQPQPQKTPSQSQKTPTSASPKEKPLKPSHPSHKTAISPKPNTDKAKTIRNAKATPSTKPKTIRVEKVTTKRGAKAPEATTNSDCPTVTVTDKPDEHKEIEVVNQVVETVEEEQEEHEEPETPKAQDQRLVDIPETESKTAETIANPKAPKTLSELGEQEEPKIEMEDKTEEQIVENVSLEKSEEQTDQIKEHEGDELPPTQENEDDKIQDKIEEHPGKGGDGQQTHTEDQTHSVDFSDEDKSHKLEQGKEKTDKEAENAGKEKMKFKERHIVEGGENHDQQSENVVLKKQEVKGKKDSQAYNDVIEVTASKLADKKRNRVLALAGAFETVISLHESDAQATPKGRD